MGIENRKGVYGRLPFVKDNKTLSKGKDVIVCLPGATIEHVTERVENTLGHGREDLY